MSTRRAVIITVAFFATLSPCPPVTPSTARAADWTSWRGPTQNGVAPETGLPAQFDIAGMMDVVWTSPYGCRSTPLVLNGRVYFNSSIVKGESDEERKLTQERVVCLDEKTGKLVW